MHYITKELKYGIIRRFFQSSVQEALSNAKAKDDLNEDSDDDFSDSDDDDNENNDNLDTRGIEIERLINIVDSELNSLIPLLTIVQIRLILKPLLIVYWVLDKIYNNK